MLKLYFYDFNSKTQVSIHEPLESCLEQALEVFSGIKENSNSYLGIISAHDSTVQISKYNKFVWLIEIPHHKKKGSYKIFLTPNKVETLIKDLYKGFNPLKINGLIYEKK